jgi:hypothetical protein
MRTRDGRARVPQQILDICTDLHFPSTRQRKKTVRDCQELICAPVWGASQFLDNEQRFPPASLISFGVAGPSSAKLLSASDRFLLP